MISFKTLLENCNLSYGKMLAQDEAKITDNDKFISHFRKNGILKKLESIQPPNEKQTLQELEQLKKIMANATQEMLRFAIHAEVDETETYQRFIRNVLKINVPNDFTADILNQIESILMYLKKHYNRARPEQFANAYNIPFQVEITHTALHPAYPSGHAFDSFIMEHVLKRIAPSKAKEIEDFTEQMRESRIYVGLHYPSDNQISKVLANEIIKSNLLKIKYPIRESTEKYREERRKRIEAGIPVPDSEYLGIGHDAFENERLTQRIRDKVQGVMRNVYGIHPGERKPELWASGHPSIQKKEGENLVSVRPSVSDSGEDIVHDEAFPEIYKEGQRSIPHLFGRIDHGRKMISMDTSHPKALFSSSSLDRVVKELKDRYPGYGLRDFIRD